MANFTDYAKSTAPRTIAASPEITLDELFEKISARSSAFQMPFEKRAESAETKFPSNANPIWTFLFP